MYRLFFTEAFQRLVRLFNLRPDPPAVPSTSTGASDPDHYRAFEELIRRIESTDDSWFVTGVAGTGKSTFLKYLVGNTRKKVAVVAPTGLAALNVGGQTIHRFFGFKIGVQEPSQIKFSGLRAHMLRALQMLVVDEVSMVRADLMNAIDVSLRVHRASDRPFGGCQLVLVGDLFQLPPVVENELELYFEKTFGGPFFFDAPGIKGTKLNCAELKTVFRQADPAFIDTLERVRIGLPENEDLVRLNGRHISLAGTSPSDTVTLTTKNSIATRLNGSALERLSGAPIVFQALMNGSIQNTYERLLLKHNSNVERLEEALDRVFPTNVRLVVKQGARVIMVKNDKAKRWVNGTVGTIARIEGDRVFVRIGDKTYEAQRETWEEIDYTFKDERLEKQVVGSFCQFPFRLAWALTIHKAQGQSLEKACIDLSGGAFAPGQTYVALSRCKALEGLYLTMFLSTLFRFR